MTYTDSEIVGTIERADGTTYRACIVTDTYPEAPENDGGFPVVRIESSRGIYGDDSASAVLTGYGDGYGDGLPESAADILERFANALGGKREAIDTFERYLHIFHDGNLVEYGPNRGTDYTYVAYVTRALWEAWGNAGEVGKAELDEYRAWIEGDVYGVVVEELTTWQKVGQTDTREEWEEIDSCYGFYGREYAEENAREQLAHWDGTPA